jgi:hypothetical protein
MTDRIIPREEIDFDEFEKEYYDNAEIKLGKINETNANDDRSFMYLNTYDWIFAPDYIYQSFAFHRILGKQNDGTHPNLTQTQINNLRNNHDFIDYFVNYLKHWRYMDFLNHVENQMVNKSRDDNKIPIFNAKIRATNRLFVKKHEPNYGPIGTVFEMLDDDSSLEANEIVRIVME